jgi:hypothetical protein
MQVRHVLLLAAATLLANVAIAQNQTRVKSAVVALVDDPELRANFETMLVARALENNYDAVTTFDLESDVSDLNDARFIRTLTAEGIEAVLMLRPTAIGAGASIESVRDEVSPEVFDRIREFAGEVSTADSDDLIAVVHMAIYTIDDGEATLVSAGAVWLDQEVEDQDEGIERLQDLIVYNVNAVRAAIRRRLGLPPLQ